MAEILKFPDVRPRHGAQAQAGMIACFAQERHQKDSVYWLKENAELLNILEVTGRNQPLSAVALAPLEEFYQEARRSLFFFRQYYRFYLSICMDLEDLAMRSGQALPWGGSLSEGLAQWVAQEELPQQELSDLQRAEAQRLLRRRGIECDFAGLDERLHQFMDASAQFALPNKKAAYELTHIVFYLSEYGKCDPGLSPAARKSLTHVGLLAMLDQDADLLAEVCIALRYAGEQPPAQWEAWLDWHREQFTILRDGFDGLDDYHMFFVGEWQRALIEGDAFCRAGACGGLKILRPQVSGLLQPLSRAVFDLAPLPGDWGRLRDPIYARLPEPQAQMLHAVETSCTEFSDFFESFARAGSVGGAA